MTYEIGVTCGIVAGTAAMLLFTRRAPDIILVAALTCLLLLGIVTPAQALSGLANPGLATVGALYVVVAGLIDTGAVHSISARVLGRPRSEGFAQLRLMLSAISVSGFINNTPVVAMLVPVVQEWARRNQLAVSKLLLPLSYAAILGGSFTLIGTNTNLVVHGLVLAETDLPAMGLFEIAWIGVPTAAAGVIYMLTIGRRLLPDREPPLRRTDDAREYTIEMLVDSRSPLVGNSITEAGLRHLQGLFLAEIQRGDAVIPAVAPTERLQPNDRLVFVGVIDSVVDLIRLPGLIPAPDQVFKLDAPRSERRFVEAVVSDTNPLVGQSIREGKFRNRYTAVVLSVARNGERLYQKVGDITIRPGDILLLEARTAFIEQQRGSRDFLLVSELHGVTSTRHHRSGAALAILCGMILAAATGLLSMLEAALAAAGLMLVCGCTSAALARTRIDWSVLTVIGASIGVGHAVQVSGTAAALAHTLITVAGDNPWICLAIVYALTSLFTEIISNIGAAVIVFPIALAAAVDVGASPWPFIVAIMMAGSASFATPIGYQTNLMVYGPGGYRFSDYVKVGAPLNLLLGVIAVLLIPLIWPF